MNAREIVSLLLETNDVSGGGRTGVYVFGPQLPHSGYAAADLPKVFADLEQKQVLPKKSVEDRTTLDQLIKQGYTFFIKHDPGNIEVLGPIPVKTTPDGQQLAMQFLGLAEDSRVKYRNAPAGSGQEISIGQTMLGSRELEKQVPTGRENYDPQWAKTNLYARNNPSQAPGGEMTPIDAPVEVGFTFDLDSREGIDVKEVHPSGPAAQAGLQAGDVIIQTGKFADANGNVIGPFFVYNQKHLAYVLRSANAEYPISFKVRRGDREMWLPIKPEIRRSQPDEPAKVSQAQPAAPAPVEPNAASPARETGNPPANVSSLT